LAGHHKTDLVPSFNQQLGVERECLALGGVVTNATIDGPAASRRAAAKRCAPASFKGRREGQMVQFAFLALAFFAAFMAARSLTAYFKQK
jgi:hypothetical protein